ncbi:hypothetical protein M378DRAFT_18603 [Amanita muscaria Koide BX008]|uniref:Acyl-protein thioesterase 1 n=1 Tax=Amanita muscaria (strain Koide BX008) TaxID=946122 RepID=A0A0C2W0U1_AMAMK|nr:hypothetical protein M378DRAFT_18603 [Amanita muscaria Koide BX008]
MPDLTISEKPYLPYFRVSTFYQVLAHEVHDPEHRHGSEKPYLPYFAVGPFYHRHTPTIICLNGLVGDTGRTMRDGSVALGLSLHPLLGHVKVILLPCMSDSQLFDTENQREDEQGLVGMINEIIQSERKAGIPLHRIIVGGLSQGEPLAGVFLLSAYVPSRRKIPDVATKLVAHLPLFWGHGKCDGQVKYDFALASTKQLAADLGVQFQLKEKGQMREDLEKNWIDGLRFHSYPSLLGHRIAQEEFDDLVVWAAYLLPDIKL